MRILTWHPDENDFSNLKKNKSLVNNTKFWSKIQISVKNKNFGQKFKFLSKIKILVKNTNFGQKYKFWSNIQILVKNENFGQKIKNNFLNKFPWFSNFCCLGVKFKCAYWRDIRLKISVSQKKEIRANWNKYAPQPYKIICNM